jgi:hypothetical protein
LKWPEEDFVALAVANQRSGPALSKSEEKKFSLIIFFSSNFLFPSKP